MEHISEDDLERYAMLATPGRELAALEEHLLICAECRERLETTERYSEAMHAAAAKIRETGTNV